MKADSKVQEGNLSEDVVEAISAAVIKIKDRKMLWDIAPDGLFRVTCRMVIEVDDEPNPSNNRIEFGTYNTAHSTKELKRLLTYYSTQLHVSFL